MFDLKSGILNASMVHAGQKEYKIASNFSDVLKGKFAVVKLSVYETVVNNPVNKQGYPGWRTVCKHS